VVNKYYCNLNDTVGDLDEKQISSIEVNDEVEGIEKTPSKGRISKERILFAGLFTLLDLLDPFVAVYLIG